MKKVFSNNRLIAIAFFTVFSVASASAVLANGKDPGVPVELKFLGNIKDQSLFQLNFSGSAEENDFTITLIDENGNRLYKENIKGENFSKKFLLKTAELDDTKFMFQITSNKSSKPVVFEIKRQSHTVEEMVVNKMEEK
jgi:hypothetical protein